MNYSNDALLLIKKEEGLLLHAYKDIAGVWTIGYGCTQYENGQRIKPGDKITIERANELLIYEANHKSIAIDQLITVPLRQGQKDALLDFVYNLGVGAFKGSTLRRLINSNQPGILQAFLAWDKYHDPNGILRTSQDLKNRRKHEIALWFS